MPCRELPEEHLFEHDRLSSFQTERWCPEPQVFRLVKEKKGLMQKIDREFLSQLKRHNVLSLDVAEHTGYYHTSDDYGVAYFPPTGKAPKKFGEEYNQHLAFAEWLRAFIKCNDIKMVAAEDVNVGKHFVALRKLSELRGILFLVCAELDIPVVVFNVSDIKKWATGNGNASKEMMIEYAQKRWHIDCEKNDNVADAVHIYFYLIHRYKL